MNRRWIVLEPQDTVAVRDGRAFDAGTHGVARAVPPHPGTVAGAVGAAFGAPPGAGALPQERGRSVPSLLHGPVVVQFEPGYGWQPRFPAPLCVVTDGRVSRRLAPHESRWAGVHTDLGDVQLLDHAEGVSGGWVDRVGLQRFLTDPAAVPPLLPAPWLVEHRVGMARNDDGTARDGMLYTAEHLRPATGGGVEAIGFAVGCVGGPAKQLSTTVFFGGEGRRATVHEWPDAENGDAGPLPVRADRLDRGRLLVYLATPAALSGGWRPLDADLRGGRLVAAAVGAAQPVAMASPDRSSGAVGHRRLVWAAPAGCVYFLDFGDDAAGRSAAQAAARAWHGQPFPQADEAMRTAGFGLALTGRW